MASPQTGVHMLKTNKHRAEGPRFVESASEDEDGLLDEEREFTWSLQKKLLLLSLCLVQTTEFASVDAISPFFPNVARDKGVSSSVIGLIFAAYPLVAGVFSPVCTLMIVRWGPRMVTMFGLMVAGTCQALFGLCHMIQDKTLFVVICFTLRVVNALGAAASETSVYSIAITEFPVRISIILGVLEACMGIGSLGGPAVGGILYQAGGFPLPFFVMASLIFTLLPLIYFALPKHEVSETPLSLRLFCRFIRIPSVLVVALCVFVGSIYEVFLEPIFSLHSQKVFGLNAAENGLIFLLCGTVYTIGALFVGWISDKHNCYRFMMTTGFLGIALGYFLIGPAPFLDSILPARSLGLVCVAFSIIGLFLGMIYVIAIPDMLRSAERYGMKHDDTTYLAVAGIFNAMANFGEVLGTILAGSLYQELGFPWATSVVAFIAGCQALFVAIFTQCEKESCWLHRFSDYNLGTVHYGP